MVIISKITDEKYQWIRVPRTATMAYSNLFLDKLYPEISIYHTHNRYNEFSTCEKCTNSEISNLKAFTLVRNPLDRFISSIYFMASRREAYINLNDIPSKSYKYCELCNNLTLLKLDRNKTKSPNNFFEFYQNEKIFYDFFYDNFDKNCKLKIGNDLHSVFDTNSTSMVGSFFYTQVHWAYHPKVKIFKYEEIHKFNEWIENELGYDTSKLIHTNASRKKELKNIVNIDFTTDKFKKLVKHLFYDDFRYFDYQFPI
jgi:hypothetical protein